MPKNVTLSLPDELGKEMSKFPEVNWSAVARESIESYVKLRQKPDLAKVVEPLIKARGEEYVRGVEGAKYFAKIKGNEGVDVVVREYWKIYWESAEESYKNDTDGNYERLEDVSFGEDYLNTLMIRALKKFDRNYYEGSDAYTEGLRKTLLEIHELVRKGAK